MASHQRTRGRTPLGLSLIVAIAAIAGVALLVTPASSEVGSSGDLEVAKKKQKKISGKLSKPGYTVIALAKDGEAKTKRASKGKFELKPPAKKVTLHLRAPDGTYAGPIVVGTRKHGKRAIEGVYAGAKLGNVTVKSSKGFAKVKLRKKWVEKKREALAKNGVPIGVGNFGRVRVKNVRDHRDQVPGDLDRDGVADPLDIDDDGDEVLDNLDRKPRNGGQARVSARASDGGAGDFHIRSTLGEGGSLEGTANVNAGMSNEQIETNLVDNLVLEIEILPAAGDRFDSSELDCGQPQDNTDPALGGLAYCTLGGTGERSPDEDTPAGIPFPECCDSDGDGFGKLIEDQPGQGGAGINPKATSGQIGSGDVLIQRVSTGGGEQQFTAALQYVFVTTPALVSYDDGQGNSASVGAGIDYPVEGGEPGTDQNPFPVKAGPDGDVEVTLTFWRPQRAPISPEPQDKWIDMGGLDLGALIGTTGGFCGPGSYSSEDPNLKLVDGGFRGDGDWPYAGFRDLAGDQPASADNTFTYRLNLTRCLEESVGRSFNVGETRDFGFKAVTPPIEPADETSTRVAFIRE